MKTDNDPFIKAYDYHPEPVDCSDFRRFPEPDSKELGKYMYDTAMRNPGKHMIFPAVHKNRSINFLTFYPFIWQGDKVAVDRIILTPGYRLSDEDYSYFNLFLSYDLECDPVMYQEFKDNLFKVFPMMDDDYGPDRIGLLMRHAYYCALMNKLNKTQWQYCLSLLTEDGTKLAEGEIFSKPVYEHLGVYGSDEHAESYKRFRKLRSKLNKESGIRITTPLPAHIETVNGQIETAMKFYSDSFSWAHEVVKERNEEAYVYGRENYIVLMPSIKDVIKDAFAQHPNLLNYLDSYVNGNVRILLLRRITAQSEPFTAFVVRDRNIESLFGPSGILPKTDVFRWLEVYSRVLALDFNPVEIINERLIEDFEGHEGYSNEHFNSLSEYAEQFRLEHIID